MYKVVSAADKTVVAAAKIIRVCLPCLCACVRVSVGVCSIARIVLAMRHSHQLCDAGMRPPEAPKVYHTQTHTKHTHTHAHTNARHSQTQVSGSTTKAEKINLANEIDLMRRADHANITLFHDAYRAKSNLWIVMEFCEGAVFWVFGWFCACDFVLGRRTRGCLKMTNPSVLKGRVCIFYLFC